MACPTNKHVLLHPEPGLAGFLRPEQTIQGKDLRRSVSFGGNAGPLVGKGLAAPWVWDGKTRVPGPRARAWVGWAPAVKVDETGFGKRGSPGPGQAGFRRLRPQWRPQLPGLENEGYFIGIYKSNDNNK